MKIIKNEEIHLRGIMEKIKTINIKKSMWKDLKNQY